MTNKKFTVDREQWLRGTNPSFLRNTEGKMCCLDFCAMQLFGYDPDDIEDVVMPGEFDSLHGYRETWNAIDVDERLDKIASINDDRNSSYDEKEKELTKLFRDAGIEIEFVN